jgi:C_GCAxxG_C_C family probable redox protein
MEPGVEYALNSFRSGYNCAQSVLLACKDDLGYDENLASAISVGFGGGMGRLQEKCGAVTGAFMVIGLYSSKIHQDNLSRKNHSYSLIQQFDQKFKSLHHTTQCRELLGCDLRTEEGHTYAVENKLFQQICEKCIADSVRILEELTAPKSL